MKSGTAASASALGVDMAEEAYVQLVREIEAERGRMTAHEAVCAERYKGVDGKLEDLKTGVAEIRQAVTGQGGKMNRWAIAALTAVMGVMLSIIAWEGGQLYQVQPLRTAQAHTTTTITAP